MCDDCQTYAHHLGRADDILDSAGGTDVYQTTPSRVVIETGHEHLRCLRLSPKGLLRWYAGCCNTPIANALNLPKLPFAGVIHCAVDHEAQGQGRDEVLGPPRAHTQGRYGHAPLPPGSYARAPFGLIVRSLRVLASARLRGEHQPSPFFDADGQLVVTPEVLSLERRNAMRKAAGQAELTTSQRPPRRPGSRSGGAS